MQEVLTKLNTTEITRKEFLLYIGALAIGILGIPSILKMINETAPVSKTYKVAEAPELTNKTISTNFGYGPYGG